MWSTPGVAELWAAGRRDSGTHGGFCSVTRVCVRRVCTWPVPPNWTVTEWGRELTAMADAAALEASCRYDPSRTSEPAVYIASRIMGRLLTRYRQEWSFATRVVPLDLAIEENAWACGLPSSGAAERRRIEMAHQLRQALARLQKVERWLIVQIFWHERDQAELARELGVSQPAISKRYRNIVQKLRIAATTEPVI